MSEALVPIYVGSLVNGVSQQPARVRLKSQGQAQENCLSNIADGVKRRPPGEHVAKVVGSVPAGGYFVHLIDRDTTERYIVLIEDSDLKVYDFDGNAATMVYPDGKAYLDFDSATYSAKGVFVAQSIADYTFIVNKQTIVSMSGSPDAARPNEFLLFISQNSSSIDTTEISLYADGVEDKPTATSNSDDTDLARNEIWNRLTGSASGNGPSAGADNSGSGGADWTAWEFTRIGDNVIYGEQVSDTGNPQKITSSDNRGDTLHTLAYKSIANFSDLPRRAQDGFVVEVTGAQGDDGDNYWVKYSEEGQVWKETRKPGLDNAFDDSTMPHVLKRTSLSPLTFSFERPAWDERLKGDDEIIAKEPAFVGQTIRDVFFHANRLGFLAKESGILSEAREYFNFWPTTATSVIDSDPVEVAAVSTQVALQDYAIPFDTKLYLFSGSGGVQHEVSSGDIFGPGTARAKDITFYESSKLVRPVLLGDAVYFLVDRETASGVLEYRIPEGDIRPKADEITAHVPTYIPGNVSLATGTTNESALFLVSDDELGSIFVYRFYWSGKQKVQSSWSRWSVGGDAEILGVRFLASTLFVLLSREDGVYLEKHNLRKLTDGGLSHRVHLDSLVELTGVYSAATNLTTWTLPYLPKGNEEYAVVLSDSGWANEIGKRLSNVTFNPASLSVTVEEDFSAYPVLIGRTYPSEYELSPPVLEVGTAQASQPITEGRLQVKSVTLFYKDTGYFQVLTNYRTGQDEEFENNFDGRYVGDPQTQIGRINLQEGSHRVTVLGEAEAVKVRISSDSYLPFTLTAARWDMYHASHIGKQARRRRRA